MCGLFGWSFKADRVAKRQRTMTTLAVALMMHNDTRGGDSWGFYSVADGKRRVGLGSTSDMSAKTFGYLTSQSVVIGHTRKATTGKLNHDNCHPFEIGTVVGAHNGIVYNHRELNTQYGRQCEVDSQHIFAHLDGGLDLGEIEAYGAIAFHTRQDTDMPVFLGRFNGGELSIGQIPGYGVVWSSDFEHMYSAVTLAGLELGVCYRVEENVIYGVTEDRRLLVVDEINITEPQWGVSAADLAATGSGSVEIDAYDIADLEKWDKEEIERYGWHRYTDTPDTNPER